VAASTCSIASLSGGPVGSRPSVSTVNETATGYAGRPGHRRRIQAYPARNRRTQAPCSYVPVIAECRLLSSDQRVTVVRHVHDLIALVMGAAADSACIAANRGLRAARLHAIQSDILARLEDPDLTVSSIAADRGISPRYVHRLFEDAGMTFSKFVLERRLTGAYRL
jgi:AraC-like DNA-binding protein